MSDSDDPVQMSGDEADDLFGDDDQGAGSDAGRAVSDNELASDKGEELYGGGDDEDGEVEVKTKVVMGFPVIRHPVPRTTDGKVSFAATYAGRLSLTTS